MNLAQSRRKWGWKNLIDESKCAQEVSSAILNYN